MQRAVRERGGPCAGYVWDDALPAVVEGVPGGFVVCVGAGTGRV